MILEKSYFFGLCSKFVIMEERDDGNNGYHGTNEFFKSKMDRIEKEGNDGDWDNN